MVEIRLEPIRFDEAEEFHSYVEDTLNCARTASGSTKIGPFNARILRREIGDKWKLERALRIALSENRRLKALNLSLTDKFEGSLAASQEPRT